MSDGMERRYFLRVVGRSLGVGALYAMAPGLGGSAEGRELGRQLGGRNGERPAPFSFVQMSDTHVGWDGALGTRALERAVDVVNALPAAPDLVLFTGDLTHDSEDRDEHARRMAEFRRITSRLKTRAVHHVPGEHDAALDGGVLYRESFGDTSYSFDHKGVHFVALDNVSRGRPEVGAERRAWLARDLARFAPTSPIVVFTHRPLFDLKPEWEWFTRDGDDVMNILAPFQNVTVLYGHIHREDAREIGHARLYAARSLSFAFPDPAVAAEKKPLPYDPAQPFRNLGIRRMERRPGASGLDVRDVELTTGELSGTEGFQQLLKNPSL